MMDISRLQALITIALFSLLALLSCKDAIVPDSAVYDSKASFETANKKIEGKYYEDARKLFEEIKQRDPAGEYAPLAQLRLADSYVIDEHPELGADEYKVFLKNYPKHKYSAYAQYQVGMVYYNMLDSADRSYGSAVKAMEAFEVLNRLYPRNQFREQATAKIARCRDLLAEHEFQVAEFYFKKESYSGALVRLTGLVRDFPDYSRLEEVYHLMAIVYATTGEYEKSDRYLDLLRQTRPLSRLIKDAEEEIAEIKEEAAERAASEHPPQSGATAPPANPEHPPQSGASAPAPLISNAPNAPVPAQ